MSRPAPFAFVVGGQEPLQRPEPPWFPQLPGPSFGFSVCWRCSDTLPSGNRCQGCPVVLHEEALHAAKYPPPDHRRPQGRLSRLLRRRKD